MSRHAAQQTDDQFRFTLKGQFVIAGVVLGRTHARVERWPEMRWAVLARYFQELRAPVPRKVFERYLQRTLGIPRAEAKEFLDLMDCDVALRKMPAAEKRALLAQPDVRERIKELASYTCAVAAGRGGPVEPAVAEIITRRLVLQALGLA